MAPADRSSDPLHQDAEIDFDPPALNGGEMPSNSDEEDSDEEDMRKVQHGDHLDQIYYWNPWEADGDDWHWHYNWVRREHRSTSNAQLYNEQATQEWLGKLSSAHRENIAQLLRLQDALSNCGIPLFEGDDGYEYQVDLSTKRTDIPEIYCPLELGGDNMAGTPDFYELRPRDVHFLGQSREDGPRLPKLVLGLGGLDIRTTAGSGRYFALSHEVVTEHTGYQVVVDVLNDKMPIWIVAARQQLQARATGTVHQAKKPVSPIFGGHLAGDDGGYDTACILSSLHSIPTSKPASTTAIFREACGLVRKTRASIDPMAFVIPEEKVNDYPTGDQTEVAELPIKTGFGQLIDGLKARLSTFLGYSQGAMLRKPAE